jgi:hypothetical protein
MNTIQGGINSSIIDLYSSYGIFTTWKQFFLVSLSTIGTITLMSKFVSWLSGDNDSVYDSYDTDSDDSSDDDSSADDDEDSNDDDRNDSSTDNDSNHTVDPNNELTLAYLETINSSTAGEGMCLDRS